MHRRFTSKPIKVALADTPVNLIVGPGGLRPTSMPFGKKICGTLSRIEGLSDIPKILHMIATRAGSRINFSEIGCLADIKRLRCTAIWFCWSSFFTLAFTKALR